MEARLADTFLLTQALWNYLAFSNLFLNLFTKLQLRTLPGLHCAESGMDHLSVFGLHLGLSLARHWLAMMLQQCARNDDAESSR